MFLWWLVGKSIYPRRDNPLDAAASRPAGGEVMSTMTFVVEFEDGKEPPVHAHMEVFGGKVVAVAFRDALEEPEEDED